jgi:iron-sulfur cluster repair protein YtfE (RIC family)
VQKKSNPSSPGSVITLENYSNCHIGILTHLTKLGKLPKLLTPVARATHIAAEALAFFSHAVFEHHLEEEQELFPVVLANAVQGTERDMVLSIIERLTREHREVEALWKRIEPGLTQLAMGQHSSVDVTELESLILHFYAHAAYEEAEFLPLSHIILGRKSREMAALGLSLHMRHQADLA